jgi:hypothetical protein
MIDPAAASIIHQNHRCPEVMGWMAPGRHLECQVGVIENHQRRQPSTPSLQEIVLDPDATDAPLHGHQEGRFFHGYYYSMPIHTGSRPAKLRSERGEASAGVFPPFDP